MDYSSLTPLTMHKDKTNFKLGFNEHQGKDSPRSPELDNSMNTSRNMGASSSVGGRGALHLNF